MNMNMTALILFILMYVLMISFSKYRPYFAIAAALIFVVIGLVPAGSLTDTIDFNVLMMLAGTMGPTGWRR